MLALAVSALVVVLWWLLGFSGLLALIALLIAITFVISATQGSPRPAGSSLGALATVRLWVGEVLAAWSLFVVAMPFERWLFARDRVGAQVGRVPVLLIHGYVNNAGSMWRLRSALLRAGHAVHTLNLEPVYAGIDDYASRIAARVDAVRSRHGGAAVALVCHSMGGLAARAYLRYCAGAGREAGLALVVTLGTPHHGTALSAIEMSPNGRQMRLGSPWLTALAAAEGGAWPCPLVSIWSRDDNIVAPQASAELLGARNLAVEGVGHISLPLNARVAALVVGELAALGPPAPAVRPLAAPDGEG